MATGRFPVSQQLPILNSHMTALTELSGLSKQTINKTQNNSPCHWTVQPQEGPWCEACLAGAVAIKAVLNELAAGGSGKFEKKFQSERAASPVSKNKQLECTWCLV